MSKNVKNRQDKTKRNRASEISKQKRKKKGMEERRFLILSLQILGIVAFFFILGYGLDTLIDSEFPYFSIAFLVVGICFSIWYGIKRFSKNKQLEINQTIKTPS